MMMPSNRFRVTGARARACALAILALAASAASARAQALSSSLDVGIASGSAFSGSSPSALLLQPSVRWDHPRTSLDAQASWVAGPDSRIDGDASVRGRYFSPVFHHLRLDLGAAAERTAGPDVTESSNAMLGDANLSLSFGAGGVWLSGGQRVSASTSLPTGVQTFGAGSWRGIGSAVITASFTRSSYGNSTEGGNFSDPTTAPGDTISRRNSVSSRQYADLQSTVYWSHGPLALDGLVGTRISTSYGQRSTWGRAQASWALGEQFALVAAGGTRAPEPAIGRIGGNFLSLGVRLASAPWIAHALHAGARSSASAFAVRADGPTRIISIHAPAARTIELMADFTDWQPVVMRHVANDEWELAMHIEPGAHRLNVRVDGGEWRAPPGAGTAQDEFNGVVGLVVIP